MHPETAEPRAQYHAFIEGRNGLSEITKLEIRETRGLVDIRGIGKRRRAIRGGFLWINANDFDQLCSEWLEARAAELFTERWESWLEKVEIRYYELVGLELSEQVTNADLMPCFEQGELPEHVAEKLVHRMEGSDECE